MRCTEVRVLLSSFHDGELGRSETEAVKSHLIGCARCRAMASDLRGLSRLFDRNEPVPPVSPTFTDSVFARIRVGEGLADRSAERAVRRLAWAAAAVLAVSAGYLALPRAVTRIGATTLDAASASEVDDEIRRNDAAGRVVDASPVSSQPPRGGPVEEAIRRR
ncbi:MAG TPA: zf-HC2 domain-containing protein [Planctomycetota bacterium]|nr:zf-HC2 domain-containing protein [Planctomycetota bacterium]